MCSAPVPCHHHHLVLSRLRVSNSQAKQRADISLEIMVWDISPQASRKCLVSAVYHNCWKQVEELLIHSELWRTAGNICTSGHLSVPCGDHASLFDSFVLPLLRLHLLGKNGLRENGAGIMCGLERRFTVIQRVCTG